MEFSWEEKRQDLLDGLATLPASCARRPTRDSAAETPRPACRAAPHAHTGEPIETAHFALAFDAKTGAISRLPNKATGREWASTANPLALLTYQTLSKEDYHHFLDAYQSVARYDWACKISASRTSRSSER